MPFYLYADAKPSESIKKQENNPAGLAVACILPHKNDEQILDIPIKQYKDYNTKQKEDRARTLIAWLKKKRGRAKNNRIFSCEVADCRCALRA